MLDKGEDEAASMTYAPLPKGDPGSCSPDGEADQVTSTQRGHGPDPRCFVSSRLSHHGSVSQDKDLSPTRMTLERDPTSSSPMPVPLTIPIGPPARVSTTAGTTIAAPNSEVRDFLHERGSGHLADTAFSTVMLLCALSIFAIVIFIASILVARSHLSLAQFGWRFFTRQAWDPVAGDFGALPFIYGTLATSFLALFMAVPLALGVAVFLTELCPRSLRAPISFLTEILAAIPSVVYGLWAVFVLVPVDARRARTVSLQISLAGPVFFEGDKLWRWPAHRQHDSRHHDSAHHLVAHARHHDRRSRTRSAKPFSRSVPPGGR